MANYKTETEEFSLWQEWQDAINDAKVAGTFCSCWQSGKTFYLCTYVD